MTRKEIRSQTEERQVKGEFIIIIIIITVRIIVFPPITLRFIFHFVIYQIPLVLHHNVLITTIHKPFSFYPFNF
jgi:hypothetical protein